MSTGLVQSIQTRLVRHAKAIGVDPNHVLVRLEGKRAQSAGFLRRSRLTWAPADLETVIEEVAAFLIPVAVHTAYIIEALRKLYDADRLANELEGRGR